MALEKDIQIELERALDGALGFRFAGFDVVASRAFAIYGELEDVLKNLDACFYADSPLKRLRNNFDKR